MSRGEKASGTEADFWSNLLFCIMPRTGSRPRHGMIVDMRCGRSAAVNSADR
jgi:hypothetical protein